MPEFVNSRQQVTRSALHFMMPGRGMENGYSECFHGGFREECLYEHWFLALDDARESIQN
ncbi:MAG: integrase core domain-containing protein [Terracidiphilus sp.]